jgi:hypothetical protein
VAPARPDPPRRGSARGARSHGGGAGSVS